MAALYRQADTRSKTYLFSNNASQTMAYKYYGAPRLL
jgi:hypothetical protein